MGWASRAGDWAFKGFTAGLGLATIYLTATFSVNVYRGLAWHNAQSICIHLLITSGNQIMECLGRLGVLIKVGLTHSNKELECLPLKVFPSFRKLRSRARLNNPHNIAPGCKGTLMDFELSFKLRILGLGVIRISQHAQPHKLLLVYTRKEIHV
ncbi:hypothetical protein QQP08_009280 [Theobroma cacao]|nr:hypothetical protein QQP08_009280 [Theobroma cacao]